MRSAAFFVFFVLLVLQLSGAIAISWWLVATPLLILAAAIAMVFVVGIGGAILAAILDHRPRKGR
jgi:hypothetical protein